MSEQENQQLRSIFIVEDDPIVAGYLANIVNSDEALALAGRAENIADAGAMDFAGVDLVLLDIGLPDGSGVDLVEGIKQSGDTKVLMITSFGDRESVLMAIEAGADGYLLKDDLAEAVQRGIHVTLEGGSPISPSTATHLLDRVRRNDEQFAVEPEDSMFTSREIEALQLFAKGASYKETADAMGISHKTIGNHVKSIYRKLAVNSRSEAVYEAIKTGQLKI